MHIMWALLCPQLCHAGAWGQDSGDWYTQVEVTTGHLQSRGFKTDAVSAYLERGMGRSVTLSVNHYANYFSSKSGAANYSQFNTQETRVAIERKLFQRQKSAVSLGLAQSQRNGFRNIRKDFSKGATFLNCPENYTDAFAEFGFVREPNTAKKRNRFRRFASKPSKTIYAIEARFDLNGAAICKEMRLNATYIQLGKSGSREVHIWHTQVDETKNLEGAGRVSSTKYRALYRRDLPKKMSTFFAYTVEQSTRFEESSFSIGISKKFGW